MARKKLLNFWHKFVSILCFFAFPSEKFKRFLPLVAGLFGVGRGVASYLIPSINVASNILDTILIGLMSCLTATGTHQIYKQMADKWSCFAKNKMSF